MKLYDIVDTFYLMNWKYDRMREPKRFLIMIAIICPWIFLSAINIAFIIPMLLIGFLRWYWLSGSGAQKWRDEERRREYYPGDDNE